MKFCRYFGHASYQGEAFKPVSARNVSALVTHFAVTTANERQSKAIRQHIFVRGAAQPQSHLPG